MSITEVAGTPAHTANTFAAAASALADAAGLVAGEQRAEQAVWVADAERHMRLGTSWSSRLNTCVNQVAITCAHPLVGMRRASRATACGCGVFLDAGTWYLSIGQIVTVGDLPPRGRAAHCDGQCLSAWLIALLDAGASVDAFVGAGAVVHGALVRANADSVDIATARGVVTCVMAHVAALRVAA